MVKHVDSNERLLLLGHRKQFTGRFERGSETCRTARARSQCGDPEVDTRFSYHLHEETDRGRVKYDISGVPGRGEVKAPRRITALSSLRTV